MLFLKWTDSSQDTFWWSLLPLHPSVKDVAPITRTRCVSFSWNLIPQDQSQSMNGTPAAELLGCAVRWSSSAGNAEPSRKSWLSCSCSSQQLACHAEVLQLHGGCPRGCSHFLSRAQEGADNRGWCTDPRGCCSCDQCQTDSLRLRWETQSWQLQHPDGPSVSIIGTQWYSFQGKSFLLILINFWKQTWIWANIHDA